MKTRKGKLYRVRLPEGYRQIVFGQCKYGYEVLDENEIERGIARFNKCCSTEVGKDVSEFILVVEPRKKVLA